MPDRGVTSALLMLQETAFTEEPAKAETLSSSTSTEETVREALFDFDQGALVDALTGLAILGGVALLVYFLVRRYALRAIGAVAKHSPTPWDDVLYQQRVFHRLTWATPLIIVHQGVQFLPRLPEELSELLQRLALGFLAIVAARAFSSLVSAVNVIYSRFPRAKERPIKGYLQVANIIAHIVGVILLVAALADKSPIVLFSGLGAMTAIFMLVFRDSLLSLVAGVQITTNDLVRVGDWIEMPQFGADGDVIDIALNSVSVQNWDKTITVIPTHKFLENSFKNWRGMQESGGRRIKRSIHIDIGTIRFLTDEEIERFGRFYLLRDYIAQKKHELEEHNRERVEDPSVVANVRRLTNVGTLRAYIAQYLRQHPGIHQNMTFLVRQLQPTGEGLPIEIYVFTNDTRWAVYEGIQADIFDHILAIVPEFGLRVYQTPSSNDFMRAFGPHDRTVVGQAMIPALPAKENGGPKGAGPMALGEKKAAEVRGAG